MNDITNLFQIIDPVFIIKRVISFSFLGAFLRYIIKLIEEVYHVYQSNSEKIEQAVFITNSFPCNNSDARMKWSDINDFCKQWYHVSKRNVIWETLVESSEYLHICYVKRNVHDETKKYGHSHNSENDLELDCTYSIYFILILFFSGIIFLFLYIKFFKKIKIKNE